MSTSRFEPGRALAPLPTHRDQDVAAEAMRDQERVEIDRRIVMVCNDGMATMTHRTTFALDGDTARRLKALAARWRVSQAEVVRRAVAQAEHLPDAHQPDLLARLKTYHAGASLDASSAEKYVSQARADRKRWRAG